MPGINTFILWFKILKLGGRALYNSFVHGTFPCGNWLDQNLALGGYVHHESTLCISDLRFFHVYSKRQ